MCVRLQLTPRRQPDAPDSTMKLLMPAFDYMTEEEIFKQTKGAYIGLLHPLDKHEEFGGYVETLINLAPKVSNEVIHAMLAGSSWRERLLGNCMAMTRQNVPESFVACMLQSLRDPRCLSIVPTCAALALLARRGVFKMTPAFGTMFDRAVFNGELAWAVDKAMFFCGLRSEDVSGNAPNDGQTFEDHVRFYQSLHPESNHVD